MPFLLIHTSIGRVWVNMQHVTFYTEEMIYLDDMARTSFRLAGKEEAEKIATAIRVFGV